MANASFLSAFLLSILTVSYLSGNSAPSLPCPARPHGISQRADDGTAFEKTTTAQRLPRASDDQARSTSRRASVDEGETAGQNSTQQTQYRGLSARIANLVASTFGKS